MPMPCPSDPLGHVHALSIRSLGHAHALSIRTPDTPTPCLLGPWSHLNPGEWAPWTAVGSSLIISCPSPADPAWLRGQRPLARDHVWFSMPSTLRSLASLHPKSPAPSPGKTQHLSLPTPS